MIQTASPYLERRHLDAPPWVSAILVISVLSTLWCAGYIFVGTLIVGPVMAAAAIAFVAWMVTFARPMRKSVFPAYSIAILAVLVHGFEQWHYGFSAHVTLAFPNAFAPPVGFSETAFLAVFVLGAGALFLWGGLGVWLAHPLGLYMAWALFCWAIASGLFDFALAIATGHFAYVPGMMSAILPIAAGVAGIRLLVAQPQGETP